MRSFRLADAVNSQGFVHLRVRSAYSLLEGAIKAGKIGKMAADAGMPAVNQMFKNVDPKTYGM